ncbi:adenosylcobinamide-GDP ribazoletransferase [Neomegalonema perideroedes]|uniref:adenosylcobinamide-GDP ribazoletransferase n=1 Tax=Neomegalonema perideroedes TaxID=217219 RepID=UPI000363A306|nr:adenosylcobinamide-GDP ribazoletransferase [Neomegalonema perideroedes]
MPETLKRRLAEIQAALMLLTRLPAGRMKAPIPEAEAAWAFPLVGVLAALLPATVFWASFGILPPFMAALLVLATGFLVTGGFHEDGLADMADGFGGGWTRERKLEIMRDSRIGTYGSLALVTALALRASGIAAAPDAASGALALIALGAASRALVPLTIRITPPARSDGIAAMASDVSWSRVLVSAGLGLGALLLLPGAIWLAPALISAVFAVRWLSLKQIGGFTGDSLGATQQIGEIALWVVLAALWSR